MPPDDRREFDRGRFSLIEHYEAIAAASQTMLAAARLEDWDEVARQEDRCRGLIARLQQAAEGSPEAVDNRRRFAILRAVLADDAEIRERAEPWLRELELMLAGRPRA
jgi:flagellar protein FliT